MALTEKDLQKIEAVFDRQIKNLAYVGGGGKRKGKDWIKLTKKRLYAYPFLKGNIERCKLDIEDIKREEFGKSKSITMFSINGGGAEKPTLEELREEIVKRFSEVFGGYAVKGSLVGEGELVLLVSPQEIRGAKSKESLPQFKLLCELLGRKCLVMSCVPEMLEETLAKLTEPPKLIITDGAHLDEMREKKPADSMLTSFAVLSEDCEEEDE